MAPGVESPPEGPLFIYIGGHTRSLDRPIWVCTSFGVLIYNAKERCQFHNIKNNSVALRVLFVYYRDVKFDSCNFSGMDLTV